jgi:endonuclease/exonuclease/phosphatase family metal-dependent hydrolase
MSSLDIYIVTFNCARNFIDPKTFGTTLFNALPNRNRPDILAISLQELAPLAYSFLGGSCLLPYLSRAVGAVDYAIRTLADAEGEAGERYDYIAARTVGLTALLLFAKPEVVEQITWIQTAGVGVGLWQMGNKGAVGMRIGLRGEDGEEHGSELTFISAHLAPFEGGVEKRNKDWENIVRSLIFTADTAIHPSVGLRAPRDSPRSDSEEEPLLHAEDQPEEEAGLFKKNNHVFFAGDLNYRTSSSAPSVSTHKSYPIPHAAVDSTRNYKQWLKDDQLIAELNARRALHGLYELPITFPPTYKYLHKAITGSPMENSTSNPNADTSEQANETWNWAPHRYPSWCDRILFLPPNGVKAHNYVALPIQRTSDHRPVALSLTLNTGASSSELDDDIRTKPPFPLNPHWRSDRAAARRKEVVVGVLAYLALTWEGNAVVIGVLAGALAGWVLMRYFVG